MRSPCCHQSAAVELTQRPLLLDDAVKAVAGDGHGALVTFSGTVRPAEDGRPISAIDYEAYSEMALRQLRAIVSQAQSRWSVRAAIGHRLGTVPAGEASVVLACSCAHRAEAFAAAQFILESLKRDVAIWKVGYRWE